jgi:hypothetical protein
METPPTVFTQIELRQMVLIGLISAFFRLLRRFWMTTCSIWNSLT